MQIAVAADTSLPFGFPATWWQWILWLVAIVIAIVTIRFTVSLDLNALLQSRHAKKIARIQNACTHMYIDYAGDGRYRVQQTFESPPGTVQYFCKRCNLASWDPEADYPGRAEYYAAHIDEYLKAEKAFSKLLKKAGYSK